MSINPTDQHGNCSISKRLKVRKLKNESYRITRNRGILEKRKQNIRTQRRSRNTVKKTQEATEKWAKGRPAIQSNTDRSLHPKKKSNKRFDFKRSGMLTIALWARRCPHPTEIREKIPTIASKAPREPDGSGWRAIEGARCFDIQHGGDAIRDQEPIQTLKKDQVTAQVDELTLPGGVAM